MWRDPSDDSAGAGSALRDRALSHHGRTNGSGSPKSQNEHIEGCHLE
jgi:hypothetical protein